MVVPVRSLITMKTIHEQSEVYFSNVVVLAGFGYIVNGVLLKSFKCGLTGGVVVSIIDILNVSNATFPAPSVVLYTNSYTTGF